MHLYSWKKGLKTGMYYLVQRGATDAKNYKVKSMMSEAAKKREKSSPEIGKGGIKTSDTKDLVCPVGCDGCSA